MVANKARTAVASADWLADVGHLAPWQVADANKAVRALDRPDQLLIMKRLAEQVGKVLREPLFASDIDLILRTASNVRGIFDGVHEAPVMARSISVASRAWDLVLKALDGLSYDALIDMVEVKPAQPRERKPAKARKTGGLAGMTAAIVEAYVSHNRVNTGELPEIVGAVQAALVGEMRDRPHGAPSSTPKPARPGGMTDAFRKRVLRGAAEAKEPTPDKNGKKPNEDDRLKEKRRPGVVKAIQARDALPVRRRSRA